MALVVSVDVEPVGETEAPRQRLQKHRASLETPVPVRTSVPPTSGGTAGDHCRLIAHDMRVSFLDE